MCFLVILGSKTSRPPKTSQKVTLWPSVCTLSLSRPVPESGEGDHAHHTAMWSGSFPKPIDTDPLQPRGLPDQPQPPRSLQNTIRCQLGFDHPPDTPKKMRPYKDLTAPCACQSDWTPFNRFQNPSRTRPKTRDTTTLRSDTPQKMHVVVYQQNGSTASLALRLRSKCFAPFERPVTGEPRLVHAQPFRRRVGDLLVDLQGGSGLSLMQMI